MKNKKTYDTNHPMIKEISIGERFISNDGDIVTFVEYDEKDEDYPFKMDDGLYYRKDLKVSDFANHHKWNIKHKYIPLKDKLELL